MPMKVMKKSMKAKTAAAYEHFSSAENDLLAKLQKRGKSPSQVAELMRRDQLSRRLIAHVRALVVVVF